MCIRDSSGAFQLGQPGAIVGDPDTAVRFAEGIGVTAGDVLDVVGTDAFSIEAWVDADKCTIAGSGCLLVAKSEGMGPNFQGYQLTYYDATQQLFFSRYVDANPSIVYAAVDNASFSHVVGTYDGVTMKLFVNGKELAASPSSAALKDNSGVFTIASGFDGVIDEVAFYRSALPAARVQAHFDAAH